MGNYVRVAFAVLLFILLIDRAQAHAIVLSATPAQGGTVAGPSVPVKLRFNSRVDAKRSRLILVLPGGEQRALTIAEAPAGDSLLSEAKDLKSGAYILRWQVLAADGHITRGELPFTVK